MGPLQFSFLQHLGSHILLRPTMPPGNFKNEITRRLRRTVQVSIGCSHYSYGVVHHLAGAYPVTAWALSMAGRLLCGSRNLLFIEILPTKPCDRLPLRHTSARMACGNCASTCEIGRGLTGLCTTIAKIAVFTHGSAPGNDF